MLRHTGLLRIEISTLLLLVAIAFASATDLNGAGATFPFPLYSKWFDVYDKLSNGAKINYQSIGSGGGIKQLMAKTVNFGASDAPLSDEERKAMGAPVIHIPTVAGAVAIVYTLPGDPKGLHLTSDVIADMFLGVITNWNDNRLQRLNPNSKLPNLPITIVHRSDGSGTTYILTSYLTAVSNTWADKVGYGKSVNWPVGLGGKGNEGVAGLANQTPGALGYVELAYAEQNKMPYAALRNKAGKFVNPSIASTTAAAAGALTAMKQDIRVSIVDAKGNTAYPIAGFTYILLYQTQTDLVRGKALVDFLWWAIHDGQQHAEPLLYAPLPKEVVKLNEAALKSVTVNGKPLRK